MSTQNTAIATLPPRISLIEKMAAKYSVEPTKMLSTLKATAFKVRDGEVSNEQMMALLVVADQYGLNPWTKEIFAFPDKGGIVPVVGVDGWTRIVNENPQFNGVDFVYGGDGPDWIECQIFRRDREHPIKVRELMAECRRDTGPWKSHPSRMLRHKAFIQCARLAFGYAGIFDPDEADAIIEGTVVEHPTGRQQRGAAGLKNALVGEGLGLNVSTHDTGAKPDKPLGTLEQRDAIVKKLGECGDSEILALVMDEARDMQWSDADKAVIDQAYAKRQGELKDA